ncbi:MAG: hypothetical protein WC716_04290 [Chitinophagaceae bacterium]|jgi:hypothetical protein
MGISHSKTKETIIQFLLSVFALNIDEQSGSKEFSIAIKKAMKFQQEDDTLHFRACIDLLEDTELAIISAFTYQLGDIKTQSDFGGQYLRLYGILNAVSLKISALIEIANLINYSERDGLKKRLQSLDIYILRNIAGSHTVDCNFNYKNDGSAVTYKETSFRIYQSSMNNFGGCIKVVNKQGEYLEYNLLSILTIYEKEVRDLLIKMAYFSIEKLVIKKEKRVLLKQELSKAIAELIDYEKLDKNKKQLSKMISKLGFKKQ